MARILDFSFPKEQREKIWWIWIGVLGVGLALGLFGAIRVLVLGLQVTGLSDQVPWGLWITQDLSAIATGAGALRPDRGTSADNHPERYRLFRKPNDLFDR